MSRQFDNQLEWSAFCYAAGELTAEEASAFEQQLERDQAAREALARAVEMTQAVVSAESLAPAVSIRSRPSVWTRRLSWMAIGSAASLLVALLWSGSGLGPEVAAWLAGPTSLDNGQLAQAWSQTREALAESRDTELWYPSHQATGEVPESPELIDEASELLSPGEAPAWMTAAVEYAEQPDTGDRDPFDAERLEN